MSLRAAGVLGLTCAGLLVPAGVAESATTIGVPSPAPTSPDNTNCPGTCTYVPVLGSGSPAFVAPRRGVIVRWRIASGSAGSVALRVLRPAAGGQLTGALTSAEEQADGMSGMAQTFPTRLRMGAGDVLGLDNPNQALVFKSAPSSGIGVKWISPALADGATGSLTGGKAVELQLNADLEPDADNDGFGDESQDGCPGDQFRQTPPCATGPANPVGNPPPTPGDKTAPVLSRLGVAPHSFRLGRRTRIAFRVSETSRVRLAFARLIPGRRRGARCVAQSRGVATGRRCTLARPRGSVSLRAQGRQSIAFDGRVTSRLLAPGAYRITMTAVDLAGNASRAATTTFTLRPRARRR